MIISFIIAFLFLIMEKWYSLNNSFYEMHSEKVYKLTINITIKMEKNYNLKVKYKKSELETLLIYPFMALFD